MAMTLHVDSQGRVLLPKEIRTLLGVEKGGTIRLSREKQAVRLASVEEGIRRAQNIFATLPHKFSSEDFLQERRREAEKEEAGK